MSQFLNEAESFDAGNEELKRSLQSLRPRSTVDATALLAAAARTEADVAPAMRPPAAAPHEQRRTASKWWPALTALSWLVTAGVWWSSQSGGSVDEPANGITSAASGVNESRGDSASAAPLGQSIVANEPDVSDDATINAANRSTASQSSPNWLALLGLDFPAFDPDAAERRWEQIQEQSESPDWPAAPGTYSGEHPSATYASLRSEFDSPIGTNWFSR